MKKILAFFRFLAGIFSIYVNKFEKKVDKFLINLSKYANKYVSNKETLRLMKEDLVVFNLWLERKYKGYKYLKKKKRKILYENTGRIVQELNLFCEKSVPDKRALHEHLYKLGMNQSYIRSKEKELIYLAQIMSFFRGPGNFLYREGANFGALLEDPRKNKLIGDCNQIVTMYIYLFGLKYDMAEMKIKILPEHVCLHFYGIDIEATSGAFCQHKKPDMKILPVEEIISTNLLDISDATKKSNAISNASLLESSTLAFLISSNKELVKKNLLVSYHNIAAELSNEGKFKQALYYARKSENKKLVESMLVRAVNYFVKKENFSRASHYANLSGKNELVNHVSRANAVFYFHKKNYQRALSLAQQLRDTQLINACYEAMFVQLQKKISHCRTVADLKKHSYVLYQMRDLANKSGNQGMITRAADLLRQSQR